MDKGFVGSTLDDTGLIHIGAREYDPSLDRFISVDPVMDLADPQQMHGYAYANNSPLTFNDPTIHLFKRWFEKPVPKFKVKCGISIRKSGWEAGLGNLTNFLGVQPRRLTR